MATPAEVFLMATQHYGAGNYPLAEQYCTSVLAAEPTHAEALHLLGVIAWHRGDLMRASDLLNRALSFGGDGNPYTWQHLGEVELANANFRAAARALEQALQRQPNLNQARNSLGVALHHVGECARATEVFADALGREPASASIHNNLATAYKDQGLFDEAVHHYLETLRLQPGHAMAVFSLSELAGAGRYRFTPEELERIKAAIATQRGSLSEQSVCCFAIANVLDKQGAFDEAFDYYRRGNDLRRGLLAERRLTFNARNHEVLTDLIMGAYDGPYFERVKGWGNDSTTPVFIVGMPRSGSTLVEQILASHLKVYGAGELDNIYGFIIKVLGQEKVGPYDPQLLRDADMTQKMAAVYLEHIGDLGKGAERIVNKFLENFLHLGIIATLFPRATIIHCRRDTLDCCLSSYFQNFLDVPFSCSLEDIGAYYRSYEKLMAHWAKVLPVKVHEVSYEALVNDQEGVSRALIACCGLDWDERCLTFWNTRRPVQTASSVQVRKPISKQAVGRWRNYQSHLGSLFRALGRDGGT
jgi:tetratricopeptide (TPR) repeat protein